MKEGPAGERARSVLSIWSIVTVTTLAALLSVVATTTSNAATGHGGGDRPVLTDVGVASGVLGDLGGSDIVVATVRDGVSCTVTALNWTGARSAEIVGCGNGHGRLRSELHVRPNEQTEPVDERIEIVARNRFGSTTSSLSIEVRSAPVGPERIGNPQVGFAPPEAGNDEGWAGYVVSGPMTAGPTFQAVSARRTVPATDCSSTPSSGMSNWVGVDGDNPAVTEDLFQAGVDEDCDGGHPIDFAWWTDQTFGYESQFLFAIHSGDVVEAEVSFVTLDTWEYRVTDLTTHQSSEHDESYAGPGSSAEWILEKNSTDLTDFRALTFSDMELSLATGGWRVPTLADALNIEDQNGGLETVTGPFSGSAPTDRFTVEHA